RRDHPRGGTSTVPRHGRGETASAGQARLRAVRREAIAAGGGGGRAVVAARFTIPRVQGSTPMKPSALAFLFGSMLMLSGCGGAKLLLAPATPPPPKGTSKTVHGPAYAPAQAARGRPDPDTDWGAYNKTLNGNRYSPLAQVNAANVGGLKQ